jgi:hypothetical protein
MKSRTSRKEFKSPEEIPETDFSQGVRGKYAAALRRSGYTIRVYKSDGSFTERRVAADSLVSLDADVKEHFPDSAAVNRALRKLISPPKLKEKRPSTPRRTV